MPRPKKDPNVKWVRCPTCHGAGLVGHQYAESGVICTRCNGAGKISKKIKKKVIELKDLPVIDDKPRLPTQEELDLMDHLEGLS
jgi:RecJ-like exonuclease